MTAQPDRMTWGFSSLGAPDLSLEELSGLARQFELDFLELRAVRGTIALPDYFRDHPGELAVQSVPIRVLSTDLRLIEANDSDIAAFMRYVELAETWQTPYLRVFGGGRWGDEISAEVFARGVKTIERCRKLMTERGSSCEMLLETHSGFSSSRTCRDLNKRLAKPLGIIWDSHHTWKLAGESLEESWEYIGPCIRHIHYKDSMPDSAAKDGYHYVLPGSGNFPTHELLNLLGRISYQGGFSLEWEKLWHPELTDIPEALGGFRRTCFGK